MKIKALALDANGRSTWSAMEIPLDQATPLHRISARQDGTSWSIVVHQPGEPVGGGPTEMHLIDRPVIVWPMSGYLENTLQDRTTRRSGAGDGIYVRGQALHHTTFARSRTPVTALNLALPGVGDYVFKR
ncbi:MAG: hypothetical protein SFV21_01105 [Rhodospirillaceae bacterium]|nr:hypothetical protein [Rhodospirillaceae bacterium]